MKAKNSGMYIRFGRWPEDERSNIHLPRISGSKIPSHELGVSVYEAEFTNENRWSIVGPHMDAQFSGTLDSFIREFASGEVEAFLVTGDRVGTGMDGEPLLRNVQVVKMLDCEEIEDCVDYLKMVGSLKTKKLKAKLLR